MQLHHSMDLTLCGFSNLIDLLGKILPDFHKFYELGKYDSPTAFYISDQEVANVRKSEKKRERKKERKKERKGRRKELNPFIFNSGLHNF